METDRPIRILFVEDVPLDAELAERALRKEGLAFSSTRVETKDEFVTALDEFQPDLIISDYTLPEFGGLEALKLSLERDASLPFIVLTGSLNEEIAVGCIKAGATDYVLKDRIARLPFSIREALDQHETHLAKEAAKQALRESEAKYRSYVEHAPLGVFVVDRSGHYVEVNPAAATMLGYAESELLNLSIPDVLALPSLETALPQFQAWLRDGSTAGEFLFRRKDGTQFWSAVNAVRLSEDRFMAYCQDITERKRAEEALRQSERKFATAFRISPDSININRLSDGLYVDINEGFTSLTGYTREEIIGRSSLALNIWADPADRARLVRGLQESGEVTGLEAVFRMKDGSLRTALMSARQIDVNGESCILSITRDITERKRAEEALLQSEKRFRALIEHSSDAIALADASGTILYASPAAYDILGIAPRQLVGKNTFSGIHPDDLERATQTFFELVSRPGESVPGQFRFRHRDGTWHWIEGIGTNLLNEPSVRAMLANYRDITERKRRERELEAIAAMATALRAASTRAEMLPVIVHQVFNLLGTDAAALVTHASATGEAVVSFGQGPWDGWTGTRIPPGKGISGYVIASGRPYLTNDAAHDPHLYRSDLLNDVCAIACVPLIAHDQTIGVLWAGRKTAITGDEVRLLIAIGDIAANALQRAQIVETLEQRVADRTRELAGANAQLATANEHLQELDRLKSKFVSDVSHELRTPIASLMLHIDLLEHGNPEKRERYLQVIRQQADRQVRLVEDILNLSRLELGAAKVQFTSVNWNALVEQAVAAHRATAEMAGLELTFQSTPDLPPVRGEPNQLGQIITNLITNAIHYTLAGQVQVSTGLNEHDVYIEVRDTGLGIESEDLPHLFERFYRGNRTRHIRGTGLGLAIVKEIVDLHDGRIEVASEVGVGSTFRVYLPIGAAIGQNS